MKHKWNGKILRGGRVSNSVACMNCGCVKERIDGKVCYFIDDNCTDKAPICDKRLIKPAPAGSEE